MTASDRDTLAPQEANMERQLTQATDTQLQAELPLPGQRGIQRSGRAGWLRRNYPRACSSLRANRRPAWSTARQPANPERAVRPTHQFIVCGSSASPGVLPVALSHS
jgi:hypothetical protein